MNKLTPLILSLALMDAPLLHASSMNQLYAAIDGGVLQANFNNHYYDQSDLIPQNISESNLQNGYTGGLALGFSHTINASAFISLELSANIDGNSALYQSGAASMAFSDEIKMRHHVDLSIIPGLKTASSFYPYLKLGVSYASIHDDLSSPVGYNPILTQYSSKKNIYGFAAGLGMEHAIAEHLGLFAEANYHDYGNQNLANFQNFSANYTHSTRLCSYEFVVGASYALNV